MEILYKKNHRARRLRITVTRDGKCVVTLPMKMNEVIAHNFVIEKSEWIQKQMNRIALLPPTVIHSKKEIAGYKTRARAIVVAGLAHFNTIYGLTYNQISIRTQKTRWGSCSKKGNLNFNYKIALLPPHLVDYIVVHELCHLAHFNHSKQFWSSVARTIPNHAVCRKELKTYRLH